VFLFGIYLIEPLEKKIDCPTIGMISVEEVPLFILKWWIQMGLFG